MSKTLKNLANVLGKEAALVIVVLGVIGAIVGKNVLSDKPKSGRELLSSVLSAVGLNGGVAPQNGEGDGGVSDDGKNPAPSNAMTVTVARIIDGDTIEFQDGARLRYIGIDAPEGGACFSSEAIARNRELVLEKEVKIEKDVSEKDRFGRMLGYVYVDDVFVNAELVRGGHALAVTYPPDVKYQTVIANAESEAIAAKAGAWTACGYTESYRPARD